MDEAWESEAETVSVIIILEDDESPMITNTSATQTFIEGSGPIDLFDPSLMLSDADNLVEHRVIQEVLVVLLNPIANDDQILFNGSVVSDFSISFTRQQHCNHYDELAVLDCFLDLLLLLQYNNTNSEPIDSLTPRRFTVQVNHHNQHCYKLHQVSSFHFSHLMRPETL